MSMTQPGGQIPGKSSNKPNAAAAQMKLNALMFQSMMKFGSAGLQGITAGQNGDQIGVQRAAQEMSIASTELKQIKTAMSAMQAQPEAPQAGGGTGTTTPVSGGTDALTGQPIAGRAQMQNI